MIKLSLSALFFAYSSAVFAFPGNESLHAVLAKDPTIQAAKAELKAKDLGADNIADTPYEWELALTGQQRRYQANESNSNEWNLGLQHGVRWPNKTSLDKSLSRYLRDQAALEYELVKEETIRDYILLWLNWTELKNREVLLNQQLNLAKENLDIVTKRVQANDASLQDANFANAELTGLSSQHTMAELASQQAEAALRSRFPQSDLNSFALPDPKSPDGTGEEWKQRILNANPRIALVRISVSQAHAEAARSQAERTPDPTLGVFVASEAQNTEKIIGINVSLPIAGAKRAREAQRTRAMAAVADQQSHLVLQQAEVSAGLSHQGVLKSIAAWQFAEQSAQAQTEATRRSKNGFVLGEIELQSLLLTQRQAIAASEQALSFRVAALKAIYMQDVDAHWNWYPMEHPSSP